MLVTKEESKGRLYLSGFTIPKGTEVEPHRSGFGELMYAVRFPFRDIAEAKGNPILRHDLTHRYAWVDAENVEEVPDA